MAMVFTVGIGTSHSLIMKHRKTEIEQNRNFRGHQLSMGKYCFVEHIHMCILACNVRFFK